MHSVFEPSKIYARLDAPAPFEKMVPSVTGIVVSAGTIPPESVV
jgi:hypothetical protein